MGDYVLVHVGFAISRIDETEARDIQVFGEISNLTEEESGGWRVAGGG